MRIHGIVVSRTSALEDFGQAELVVAPIAAVVREVLRDEIDLARALRLEQLRLVRRSRRARTSDACRASAEWRRTRSRDRTLR